MSYLSTMEHYDKKVDRQAFKKIFKSQSNLFDQFELTFPMFISIFGPLGSRAIDGQGFVISYLLVSLGNSCGQSSIVSRDYSFRR